MAQITYTDKDRLGTGVVRQWTDDDANEVKASVNALYSQQIADYFTARETIKIANTTVETSLIGDGDGTLTIPSAALTLNKYIQLRAYGYISTGASNTNSILKIKFGGVDLIANTGTLPANMDQSAITLNAIIKVVDGGVTLSGYTLIQGGVGITTVSMRSLNVVAPVVVDLTEACLVEHTYTWVTASTSNAITITNFEVLVK